MNEPSQTKSTLLHIVYNADGGGITGGIKTLLANGFYEPFDTYFVPLLLSEEGALGPFTNHVGDDHVVTLEKSEPPGRYFTASEQAGMETKLDELFQRLKPHAVILSGPMPQMVGAAVALSYPDVNVFSFEHATINFGGFPELQKRMEVVFSRTDVVLADSPTTFSSPHAHYPESTLKITVPLTLLESKNRVMRSSRTPVRILSLGRLSAEKNYEELIPALARLLKDGHDVELRIAGEGSQRQELEALIKTLASENPSLGVASRIQLVGHVADTQNLSELRNWADIYIQPSKSEGFGIAAVEALSAGLPTVVTDFAGARDWGTEQNILKIEGFSQHAIAKTLDHLITHYDRLAPGMSRAALDTVSARFSKEQVQKLWKTVQVRISEGRPQGRPTNVSDSTDLSRVRGLSQQSVDFRSDAGNQVSANPELRPTQRPAQRPARIKPRTKNL